MCREEPGDRKRRALKPFYDAIGREVASGDVAPHEHDADDTSGGAVFSSVKADRLYSESITGEEIVSAACTEEVIRSDNYIAATAGWAILEDGSAEVL
jgi:hypothetical protein